MSQLRWEFGSTDGGRITGLKDPTVSNFKGKPYYYLAREPIQNVIDNKLPNSNPAIIKYELIQIKAAELPEINDLKNIFIKIKEYNEGQTDCVNFFGKAIRKIENNAIIQILKISDFNTTGLYGDDDDKKGSYWKFAKAVGYSTSEGSGGGSWGLGKGSYYAASNFRTVFFSSVYDENKVVFQGQSFLASHEDNGKIKQGNGSFGLPGQKAVRSDSDIPIFFQRKDQGTDFFILDYSGSLNWEDEITTSVLDNFWPAIHEGILEVKIGKNTINKENLYRDYFAKYFSLYNPPDTINKPNPLPYYFAYTRKDDVKIFEADLLNLGKVKLNIYFDSNFKNKIVYFRNTGMIIEKKREFFPKGFSGVFSCLNERGSFILRKMENQQHDQWRKENASDTDFYDMAVVVEAEIKKFISDCFKELSKDFSQTQDIPGLEDYLASKDDLQLGNLATDEKMTEEESAIEKARNDKKQTPPLYKKIKINKTISSLGIVGSGKPILNGKGHGGKGGQGGSEGDGDKHILTNCLFRTFYHRDSQNKIIHKLLIRKGPPLKSCDIEIKAGTDSSLVDVGIYEVKGLNQKEYATDKNIIKQAMFNDKGELNLDICFNDNEKYSLNIIAYVNN
ncbi:MAG: hypothetical protein AAB662_04525 [Patescibacteria group bacterium]